MLQSQPEILRPVAIIDAGPDALQIMREELFDFDVFDFDAAPAEAPNRQVVLWPAPEPASKERAVGIASRLFAASDKPRSVQMADDIKQVAMRSGRIIAPPKNNVVRLSHAEQKAARKAAALAPVTFRTLAAVNQGQYTLKTPLFEDDEGNGILFPGAHLIVGRPKIGKSWLLLQLALAVAYGETFLSMKCRRPDAEVLLICAEDDDARVQLRLGSLGINHAPASCYVVTLEQFRAIATLRASVGESFTQFLDAWLTENPKCRLVVIDTETTCRQTWCGEKASGDDTQRITETDYRQTRDFDAIALKHECVIGLVNHASKRKGEWSDIHELINRSNTALAGASGSLVLADPPDADPLDTSQKLRILGARGRDMRDDLLLCVKQEQDLPRFTNLGEYRDVQQTQAETEILQALEDITADQQHKFGEYVSTADIADWIGSKQHAVKRTVTRMLAKPSGTLWKQWRVEAKRGRNGGLRLIDR